MTRLLLLVFYCTPWMLIGQSLPWQTKVSLPLDTEATYSEEQRSVPLAFVSPETRLARARDFEDYNLGFQILQSALSGDLSVYRDAELRQPVSPAELKSVVLRPDTVQYINTETYETQLVVVRPDLEAEDFRNLELNINLTYTGAGQMQQDITSGCLVLPIDMDRPQSTDGLKKLYFSIRQKHKTPKVGKHQLLRLFQRIVPAADFSASNPEFTIPAILSESRQSVSAAGGRLPGFHSGDGKFTPLSPTELTATFQPSDTIVTFSPETYEQVKQVVERPFPTDQIEALRLQFYLGWEDKKSRLTVYPAGYAPLFVSRGEGGELQYILPLYYYLPKGMR